MLSTQDIFMRLAAAMLAGTFLGIERENHGRAAGLRTTVLVCVAAALAMILSDEFYAHSLQDGQPGGWHPDPARLAAGILAGMGFLGGGAIVRQGDLIRGVTTAAVLWMATVLGLCFGNGAYILGGMGLGAALMVVLVFPAVERWIKKDWYGHLQVTVEENGATLDELRATLHEQRIHVKSVALHENMVAKQRVINFSLKYKKDHLPELSQGVMAKVKACRGVLEAHWE